MEPDPSAYGTPKQQEATTQEFNDLLMQYVEAVRRLHFPVQPVLTGAAANLVMGSTRLSLPSLD